MYFSCSVIILSKRPCFQGRFPSNRADLCLHGATPFLTPPVLTQTQSAGLDGVDRWSDCPGRTLARRYQPSINIAHTIPSSFCSVVLRPLAHTHTTRLHELDRVKKRREERASMELRELFFPVHLGGTCLEQRLWYKYLPEKTECLANP